MLIEPPKTFRMNSGNLESEIHTVVIQFTIQDITFALICVLVTAVGVILLPTLWNIKKVSGILRPLVETNQESIKNVIRTMPRTLENVAQISSNVRETTEKLKTSVPVILQEVECVTDAAKESVELAGVVMKNVGSGISETVATYKKDTSDFPDYFHILEEVLQVVYRTFSSGK